MNRLFSTELELPVRGRSMRVTRRPRLAPGDTFVLFDEDSPGCIFHWWLTYNRKGDADARDPLHDLQLRLYYDGESTASVDIPLAHFFGVLLDHDVYEIDSAAIKILPANALNCYLPMPFGGLRIELENRCSRDMSVWFMADWQQYEDGVALTDKRLHVRHEAAYPADKAGSFLMADFTGEGFVAGLVKGVRVRDRSDSWYHSGGDLWLLDGEGDPHAIRGIGGEDVFNMSFGIYDVQTDWVGVPYLHKSSGDTPLGSGYEGVMYRFFGPDPVWFDPSAVVRFGSKANDLESVVYAYLCPKDPPETLGVPSWQLAGPFECRSYDDFEREEWADSDPSEWPGSHTADFGQYLVDSGPATFQVPVPADPEHGWCDFARHFRGSRGTNVGTQPCDVSAYAVGAMAIPEDGDYVLQLGFDDWLRLWVDDQSVLQSRHDQGFAVERIGVRLSAGDHLIRVKLSNADNAQWRLWAFSLTAAKAEPGSLAAEFA